MRSVTGPPRRHILLAGFAVVMLLASVLGGVSLAPGALPPPQAAAVVAAPDPDKRPDVIVVMTDDQRVGSQKGMPFLWDTLREQMTYYPNAAVPTNNCCPARSSFLAGQLSHTTGVWDNTAAGPSGGWHKFETSGYERKTIAVALRNRGYRTVLLGKYLNQYSVYNDPLVDKPPGWSDFRTYVTSTGGYWSPPHPIADVPEGYTTDTLGDAAAETIAATPTDQPLFLMYTPYAPHAPANAGPYKGTAAATGNLRRMRVGGRWGNPAIGEPDRSDKPPHNRALPGLRRDDGPGIPFPKVRRVTEAQADTLMGVDANLRKIVTAQQQLRNWDNTILVYLSDNGVAWGDHALFDKTTPYRLTDGIPLLMKYPSWANQPPRTDSRLINQIDVTTTIAALTGARLKTAGYSAVRRPKRTGLLMDSPQSKRGYAYWHPSYCGWRTKKALYVRSGDGNEELYDYAVDPYELTNRATNPRYAPMKARMSVATHLACDPAPPGYVGPRPALALARRTPSQARLTLRPGIGTAVVHVQRLTKTGWVRVGSCSMPTGKEGATSRVLRVDRRGAYRARMQPIGAFPASGWTEPVRMRPAAARLTCR